MHINDQLHLLEMFKKYYIPKEKLDSIFVPSLLGNSILLRSTLRGRISAFFQKESNIETKVNNAFRNALNILDSSARINIPYINIINDLRKLLNLEPSEENSPDDSTPSKLSAMKEITQKHSLEYLNTLSTGSGLHTPPFRNEPLSAAATLEILGKKSELSQEALEFELEYLKSKTETQKVDNILVGQKFIRELIEKYKKGSSETVSNDLALSLINYIHSLKPGEQKLFCGSYGKNCNSIQGLFHLLKLVPRFIIDELDEPYKSIAQRRTFELHSIVQNLLHHQISGNAAKEILDDIEQFFQNPFLKKLLLFLPDGPTYKLLQWLIEKKDDLGADNNSLGSKIESKVLELLNDPMNDLSDWSDTLFNQLFNKAKNLVPNFVFEFSGLNKILFSGEMWIEFKRQADGNFSLLIYPSGVALNYHLRDEVSQKVVWPLHFENIHAEKLDLGFLHRLLTMSLVPLKDSQQIVNIDDFYNGLLHHLEQEPSKPRFKELQHISTSDFTQLDQILAYCNQGKTDLFELKYQFHQAALVQYCKDFKKNEGGCLVIETAEQLKVMEQALVALKEDNLKIQNPKIQASIKEIELAIAVKRKADKREYKLAQKYVIPKKWLEELQGFLHRWDISPSGFAQSKKIFYWLFGKDAEEFIDTISHSLSTLPPLPVNTSTKNTGWLESLSSAILYYILYPVFYLVFRKENLIFGYIIQYAWKGFMFALQYKMPKEEFDKLTSEIQKFQSLTDFSSRTFLGKNTISFDLPPTSKKASEGHLPKAVVKSNQFSLLEEEAEQKRPPIEPSQIIDVVVYQKIKELEKVSPKAAIELLFQLIDDIKNPLTISYEYKSSDLELIEDLQKIMLNHVLSVLQHPFKLDRAEKKLRKINDTLIRIRSRRGSSPNIYSTSIVSTFYPDDSIPNASPQTLNVRLEKLYYNAKSAPYQEACFQILNEIESWEVPQKGKKTIWDEISDPSDLLAILSQYSTLLIDITKELQRNPSISTRTVIASYTLLAVTYHLAQKNPEALLNGFTINAFPLLSYFKAAGTHFETPELIDRTEKLCAYFFPSLNISTLPKDIYASEVVKKLHSEALFVYDSMDLCSDEKYYKKLLQTPKMQEWYKSVKGNSEFSIPPDHHIDQYPAVKNKSNTDYLIIDALDKESFNLNNDWELYPKEFAYLKRQTCVANKFATSGRPSRGIFYYHVGRRIYNAVKNSVRRFFVNIFEQIHLPPNNSKKLYVSNSDLSLPYERYTPTHYDELSIPQHELLNAPKKAWSDFFIKDHPSLSNELEKIFTQPENKIPRLLEFLCRYKLELKGVDPYEKLTFLMDSILFESNQMKTLLSENPDFADRMIDIFYDLYEDFSCYKCLKWKLWLHSAANRLKKQVDKYAPHHRFKLWGSSGLLLMCDNKDPVIRGMALQLYAETLPDDPYTIAPEDRTNAISILLRAFFHPANKVHSVNFLEKFIKWSGSGIFYALLPIKSIFLEILEDRQIRGQAEKRILSSCSKQIVQLGDYKFNLKSGEIEGPQPNLDVLKLVKIFFKEQFKDLKKIPNLLFNNANNIVSEDGKFQIFYDERLNSIKIFKKFRENHPNTNYQYYDLCETKLPTSVHAIVKEDIRRIWRQDLPINDEKSMLLETVSGRMIELKYKGNSTNLRVCRILIENEEYVAVDPFQIQRKIAPLARFCSFEDMQCWKRAGDDHLAYVYLDNADKLIEISQNQGELQATLTHEGTLYHLPNQPTDPSLLGIPSYLLLETESGEKQVIVPESQWFSTPISRVLSTLKVEGPLRQGAEELTGAIQQASMRQNKYFTYCIESDGELSSEDPEAMAYLVTLRFLQGKTKKADQVLKKFIRLSKLKPFPNTVLKQLIPLILSPASFENAGKLRLELLAALEENHLLHPKEDSPESSIALEWLFSLVVLYDLQSLPVDHTFTEDQEWFLYRSVQRGCTRLPEIPEDVMKEIPDFIKAYIPKKLNAPAIAAEIFMEVISAFSPKLKQRYLQLKEKFGVKEPLRNQFLGKIFGIVRTAVNFYNAKSTFSYGLPSRTELKGKSKVKNLVISSLFQEIGLQNIEILRQRMRNRQIQNPHLIYQQITPEDIKKEFVTYYAIARGERTPEERDALLKLLPLIKGGWCNQTRFLIECLEHVTHTSFIYSNSYKLMDSLHSEKSFKEFFEENLVENSCVSLGKIMMGGFFNTLTDWKTYAFDPFSIIAKVVNTATASQEVPLPLPIKPENIPVIPPSYAFLDVKEKAINTELKSLFDLAFKEIPNTKEQTNEQLVEPFDHENTSQSEEERFGRVNNSLQQFKERPKTNNNAFQFLGNQRLWKVSTKALALQAKWKKQLDKQEKEILAVLNPPYLANLPKLKLEDLKKLLLTEQVGTLSSRLGLDAPELQKLEEAFISYAALQGHFKQINRVLDHFEKVCHYEKLGDTKKYKEHLSLLGGELIAQRSYSFATVPPRELYRYVFFEWLSNLILWKNQLASMTGIIAEKDGDLVQELLMANGKTIFINPTLKSLLANGNNLVFNAFAEELAETNIRDGSKQSNEVYGQTVNTLPMNREDKRDVQNYRAINIVLDRVMEKQETIDLVKTDAQSLELNLLEQAESLSLLDELTEGSTWQTLEELKTILANIRSNGILIGDEYHSIANPKRQLRYPIGQKFLLSKKYVLTIERCYKALTKDPDIFALVRDNELHKLDVKIYEDFIAPDAAERLSYMQEYDLQTDEKRKAFVQYVCGKADHIPEFIKKHPKFDDICVIKGFFTILFRNTLSEENDTDMGVGLSYGFSNVNGRGVHAIPYYGLNNPLNNCTIQSPFEDHVKTALTYLHLGLEPNQMRELIQSIVKSAESSNEAKGILKTIDTNSAAYQFWCELFPTTNKQTPSIDLLDACTMKEDSAAWKKIVDTLQFNPRAIFFYIRNFASKQITYWKQSINSNAQNFASMFKSLYFYTGTPYNDGTYHWHLKMLWDPGTIGEALHILFKKCPQKNIDIIKATKPSDILERVLEKYFSPGSNFSMFIDGGAYLKMSNEDIAERILDFCPTKKAVVFYKKIDGKDLLVFRERRANKSVPPKDLPFDQCKLLPSERITFVDSVHAFGMNVPQDGSAINLVKKQPFYHFLQEIFRLRPKRFRELYLNGELEKIAAESSFKENQQIHLAMVEEAAIAAFPGKNVDEIPIRDVISRLIEIEANQAAKDNFQAFQQKMHDIVRRKILDKMIYAPDLSTFLSIFKKFAKFLISAIEDDPIKLFSWIQKEIDTEEVLKMLKNEYYGVIKDSEWFSEKEKLDILSDIIKLMDPDTRPPMPPTVTVFTDGEHINVHALDSIGQEVTLENNTTQENDHEQNTENNQQNENTNSDSKASRSYFKEKPWPKDFNPRSISTLKNENNSAFPRFYSLVDVLKKSTQYDLKAMANGFDNRIWFTNNFLPRLNNGVLHQPAEVGSDRQCNIFDIVVHYKGNEILAVGCLTQEESETWKKQLRKNSSSPDGVKTMIYAPYKSIPTGGDSNDFNTIIQNPEFQNIESQLRFINGETDYPKHKKPLRRWLRTYSPAIVIGAFHHINNNGRKVTLPGTDIDNIIAKLLQIPPEDRL